MQCLLGKKRGGITPSSGRIGKLFLALTVAVGMEAFIFKSGHQII